MRIDIPYFKEQNHLIQGSFLILRSILPACLFITLAVLSLEVVGADCPINPINGRPECSYSEAFAVCEESVAFDVANNGANACNTEGDFSCRWCGIENDRVRKFRWSTQFPPPGKSGWWDGHPTGWYIIWNQFQQQKNRGQSLTCGAGNPINPGTGNKFQVETDYTGNNRLTFRRYYNSVPGVMLTAFDNGWSADFFQQVRIVPGGVLGDNSGVAQILRPDGQIISFRKSGSNWISDADVLETLTELTDGQGVRTGWELVTRDDVKEVYAADGKLTSLTTRDEFTTTLSYTETAAAGGDDDPETLDKVTGPFLRTLSFTYDTNGRVASLIDPAGEAYLYDYDINGNLEFVTYPDETPGNTGDNPTRQYHYEDTNFIHALTGIIDETGQRFATYGYDTEGRATFSEHAGGAERVDIIYNVDGTSTVSDALGANQIQQYAVEHGTRRTEQVIGDECGQCGAQSQNTTYDVNGFVASSTDFNGNFTTFINNTRGLQTSRTEAVGTTEERTITTEWHTTFRLPTKVTEPGKETILSYDSVGRVLTRTEKDTVSLDTRTTTNTYYGSSESSPEGLIKSIDGPRTDVTDVTTFDYDSQGNLTKTTNALGQETDFTSHDAHGRPLTIEDPNGTITILTYDARGRLLTRVVDNQTTTFEYDGVGNITKTILPNGSFLVNEYDAAQRLKAVEDNLGNRIEYTLDDMGNRTKEDVKDPGGVLTRTMSHTYNSLSRLIDTTGGAGQLTTFGYDDNGNQTNITVDPTGLNQQTVQAFDALNRLLTITDAANGVTTFDYDERDNLVSVEDPTGQTTTYAYDGLNNLTQQVSPDTQTTTFTYDDAGNRLTQTDARGIITDFSYDALNRLTTIVYPEVSPGVPNPQNVTFAYDTCTNGTGRLCKMTDESGTTSYTYDGRGNLISQVNNMDGRIQVIGYSYNGADQVTQITYPSERTVDYSYNTLGQVSQVTTTYNGTTETLISNLGYKPFGPITAFNYGNGLVHARAYDQDYRLTDMQTTDGVALQDLDYTLNKADNIIGITNVLDATRNQGFDYDALNRLTDADGIYPDTDYSYDANSNRQTSLQNSITDTYTYAYEDITETDSHRLLSIDDGTTTQTYSYDANGNTTSNGALDFVYGDNNRLQEAKTAGTGTVLASYVYNGRGERVKKITPSATIYYHYNQSGQLLAETGEEGESLKEYFYLGGMPVGLTDIDNQSAAPITLDNDDCGFVMKGDWTASAAITGYEGTDYRQTSAGTGEKRADWLCSSITVGKHRVYAKWTADTDRATNATYTITHTGGTTSITVNQQEHGGQFNYLGNFDLDTTSRISLSDDAGGVIIADAVRVVNMNATTMDVTFIHTDHLGTPQMITDGSQNVVWEANYEPFGKVNIVKEDITNNIRFPGQYFDSETNLHYNWFRYYDPVLGRYITSDPIGISAGPNTYNYALQNSIRYIDPSGKITEFEALLGKIYYSSHKAGVQAFMVSASFGVGYLGGTGILLGINYGYTKFYGSPTTLGTVWYEFLNQESPVNDIDNTTPPFDPETDNGDPNLPDLNSPDPVDETTMKLFCELNPDAPNCQNNLPNECN